MGVKIKDALAFDVSISGTVYTVYLWLSMDKIVTKVIEGRPLKAVQGHVAFVDFPETFYVKYLLSTCVFFIDAFICVRVSCAHFRLFGFGPNHSLSLLSERQKEGDF